MSDKLTYESWCQSIDYLWRESQLPYQDIWVHHPRDVRVGSWVRKYDYSKWDETEPFPEQG